MFYLNLELFYLIYHYRDSLMLGVDVPSFICGYDYVNHYSFAFDKNRYYEGSPNPRLEKLRQGKCQVEHEWSDCSQSSPSSSSFTFHFLLSPLPEWSLLVWYRFYIPFVHKKLAIFLSPREYHFRFSIIFERKDRPKCKRAHEKSASNEALCHHQ